MASPALPWHQLLSPFVLLALSTAASAYVSIPWQTERVYGFDGPWQAIKVSIGSGSASTPPASVDLLPGGSGGSFILSPELCSNSASHLCGLGGVVAPEGGSTIFLNGLFNSSALSLSGPRMFQDLAIGGDGTSAMSVPDVSLVSVTSGNAPLPNGLYADVEVGTFSLGASGTIDAFGPNRGWEVPGYLYNQGKIPSYSYGLHIGSALLNYTGSLVFGGFDRGRAIGPGFHYSNSISDIEVDIATVALVDITMGYEGATSPFTDLPLGVSGLLVETDPVKGIIAQTMLPFNFDPALPYFYLPQETCDKIAGYLPITYDTVTKYYLWDTNDPAYRRITTSGGWLGFKFQAGTTVVIKVPFTLLNLFLTGPALPDHSTLAGRPYFPCMPYKRDRDDHYYSLGRAFMQAAFVGCDWGSGITWVAQAPGPGAAGRGLSTSDSITDIPGGSGALPYSNTDASLFASSWNQTWQQLAQNDEPYVFPIPTFVGSPNAPFPGIVAVAPGSTSSSDPSSTSTSKSYSEEDGRLSKTAQTAIAVSLSVAGILVVFGVLVVYPRIKKRAREQAALRDEEQQQELQLQQDQREGLQRLQDQRRPPPARLDTIEVIEDDVPPPAYEKDPPIVQEKEAGR